MKRRSSITALARLFLALVLAFSLSAETLACTSVFVGKDASATGKVLIARNEDYRSGWAKHFIVNEAVDVASGDVQTLWSGMELGYPEGMTKTLKYFSVPDWVYLEDDEYVPMDEVGINEAGVAVSATETQGQNATVRALGINPLDGLIEESQIPSIILPRARTAREGVTIFGAAIETFGAEESGGFAIADKDEVWYIEYSGRLWAAARVPDDRYIIVPNENVLSNFNPADGENFLGAADILPLARENALLPEAEMTDAYVAAYGFNFAKAFGSVGNFASNGVRVWWGHQHFTPSLVQKPAQEQYPFFMKPDEKITKKAIMDFLKSDNYYGTTYENARPAVRDVARPIAVRTNIESHIVEMGQDDETPGAIGNVLWLAMGNVHDSVYLPFCSGITEIPEAYGKGTNVRDEESAFWAFYGPAKDAQGSDDTYGTKLEKALQAYWNPYQDALLEAHDDFIVSARRKWSAIGAADAASDLTAYLNDQARVFSEKALAKSQEFAVEIAAIVDVVSDDPTVADGFAPLFDEADAPKAEDVAGYVTAAGSSSGGCSAGTFAPAALLLLAPLAFFRRRG